MTALQGGSRDEGSRPSRWRRGGEWCQARAAAEGASDAPLAKAQGSTIDNMLTNIIIVSGSKTTYQEKSWGMLSRITSLKLHSFAQTKRKATKLPRLDATSHKITLHLVHLPREVCPSSYLQSQKSF